MSRGKPGYQRPTNVPIDVDERMRPGRRPGAGYSGGGGVDVSVRSGGGGSIRTLAPPWVWMPAGGVDFQAFGSQAGLTAASGRVVLASAQIPPNRVGVIRSLSILANSLLTTSDIVWSLRFNGNNVSGWDALTILPRSAGSVEVSWTPEETYIHAPEGSLVELSVEVNDAGTYQLGASFHGWHYSSALASVEV